MQLMLRLRSMYRKSRIGGKDLQKSKKADLEIVLKEITEVGDQNVGMEIDAYNSSNL